MIERIRNLLTRWRDITDIEALSEQELDDLGLTRDQLRHFAQMPADVPDRVSAMGAIFGLSEGELRRDHAAWNELLETCGDCPDRAACRRVLEKGGLANPRDTGFCPNRHSFISHWAKT